MKRITSSSSPNVTGNRDVINPINHQHQHHQSNVHIEPKKPIYGVSRIVGDGAQTAAAAAVADFSSTSSSSVSTSILTQELLGFVIFWFKILKFQIQQIWSKISDKGRFWLGPLEIVERSNRAAENGKSDKETNHPTRCPCRANFTQDEHVDAFGAKSGSTRRARNVSRFYDQLSRCSKSDAKSETKNGRAKAASGSDAKNGVNTAPYNDLVVAGKCEKCEEIVEEAGNNVATVKRSGKAERGGETGRGR